MPTRTYKYRLRPTVNQRRALESVLEAQRQLYNELLGWKQCMWEVYRECWSEHDIYKWLTKQRAKKPSWAAVPINVQRGTVRRLELAFRSFFRRCKAGQKPGYPRFKSKDRWDSFKFREFDGITFDGKRIRLKGIPGRIKVNLHRSLPKDFRFLGAVLKRGLKGWEILFIGGVSAVPVKPLSETKIGIDVGLTHLATLSTEERIANPKHTKAAAVALRIAQRKLSRCQRGSNRRTKIKHALRCCHAKIANSRNTYLHQVSRDLVNRFDLIAVEKLNIKGMAQDSRFAKGIHDAAWAQLRHMLTYKAEDAGKLVVEVDPKNTSQECSECHRLVPKDLKVRVHSCPHCNLVLDRDHNAALNILHRAVVSPKKLNVAGYRMRASGTLACKSS